tara:strand:+ start:1012 stop:2196 length:1185 start_codon:yes stop_codon:yes gene_type:complete
MKINDKETLSIAAAVSDVLEGKVKKEEAKYPHDMWSPEGEKAVAKDEAEHKALAKKGYSHDKPEVDEVAEPVAKGEKDFKAKHKIKKSGEKEDGTVVKEKKDVKTEGNKFTMALNAARKNGDKDFVVSGKKYKVEDYDEDEDDKEEVDEGTLPPALQKAIDKKKGKKTDDEVEESADEEDEEEVEEAANKGLVKKAVALALKMSGNMTGATKKIEKMQKGLSKDKEVAAALQLANEERIAEADDKKAKYKAFFDKALNKFGVDSPAELKGDKKKEFFDYVDKNYNSEDEPGKDGVNEVLGFVKKVANKVKDTVTGKSDDTPTKNPVTAFSNPSDGTLGARLKIAKQKLKDAQEKAKKAAADGNEKGMDHWNEVEMNREADVEKLQKKLKKEGVK